MYKQKYVQLFEEFAQNSGLDNDSPIYKVKVSCDYTRFFNDPNEVKDKEYFLGDIVLTYDKSDPITINDIPKYMRNKENGYWIDSMEELEELLPIVNDFGIREIHKGDQGGYYINKDDYFLYTSASPMEFKKIFDRFLEYDAKEWDLHLNDDSHTIEEYREYLKSEYLDYVKDGDQNIYFPRKVILKVV